MICIKYSIKILLPHHELIIHIDSDAIFLSPVEELWSYFDQMNGSQIAALATEDMNPKTNWNLNHRTAPFPSKYGLNAGIMLMNLTRMREINFFSELEPIAQKYKGLLPWFDQDVINVYFYQYPEKYLMLPCKWNFLTAHCNYSSFCESAENDGIALLHGSKSSFHIHSELAFRAIYLSFKNYKFFSDLKKYLIDYIEEYLSYIESNCAKNPKTFTKNLEKILRKDNNIYSFN
jgi:UDP-xylose:glucoside alpha-1,3-xylosyltransferase